MSDQTNKPFALPGKTDDEIYRSLRSLADYRIICNVLVNEGVGKQELQPIAWALLKIMERLGIEP